MKEFENREVKRHQLLSDLSTVYEGASEDISIDLPDLSTRGMFIPTRRLFPIGSILKVHFKLPRSNFQVNVRAEVRHCTPNSGVGVEFIGLSLEAARAIQKEIEG
jgi:Tfp pilus assembly protein PilZ